MRHLSIQTISNEESIEKYGFEQFYLKKYSPVLGNGINLSYQNEEEDSISDNEIAEIFEMV